MRAAWITIGLVVALLVGGAVGYSVGTSSKPAGLVAAENLGETLQTIYEGPDTIAKVSDIVALYADGAVIDDMTNDDHFEGADQLRWANAVVIGTPDFDMQIEHVIPGDGMLALVWTMTGSDDTEDGFRLPGVSVFELDGELIGHEYYYYESSLGPQ